MLGSQLAALPIDITATFVEGLASFLQPCVLPLVPGYLSFISGVSVAHNASTQTTHITSQDTRRVVVATLFFIAGFTAAFLAIFGLTNFIFTLLGADIKPWVQVVAGIAVIVMGLHFIGVFRIGFLNMEKRFHFSHASKPAGWLGAFLVGSAFAAGWTPCIGPLLSAAINGALNQPDATSSLLLMIAYCAGLGLPFLLAGIFMNRLLVFMARIRRHYQLIEIASGILLVVIGVLIITNNMSEITRTLGRLQGL